jgi:hypothetical protein
MRRSAISSVALEIQRIKTEVVSCSGKTKVETGVE